MRFFLITSLIATLFLAACSHIPKNYEPARYRSLAVIAFHPAVKEVEIESVLDVVGEVVDALTYSYPEWTATSDVARAATDCDYDVYLLAPESYFENRKSKVDVAHQNRFEGVPSEYYNEYIKQMKSLVKTEAKPVAYIIGRQSSSDENSFWLEMRNWKDDSKILAMDYRYFMKHYREFFCQY